ncbi:MAG: putative DNA binding domain-containing protein [Bacteroidaceae bacterium]|nr:putative DNA binding domain-containing protein [Bacteroidaceae bacterium]
MVEVRNITDFNDYLESLLIQNESDDLEFKSAAGGFPGSFWDTYSAFANTDGGTIVLGVQEKKGKFFLDNLSEEQIEKYRKDFWNNVNNTSTISRNLMQKEDVVIGNYKGFAFMLFFVPRAPRELRPVYRTNEPYKGTYKRNYEGDYRCTEREVQRMFADADDSRPADSRILKNYTIEDLDIEALSGYRQLFKVSHPDHPWHTLNDVELLRMLGGYRKDRQTGEEGFTVAGLLMFGKSQAITDVECMPHFFPDYQEHLTDDEDIRWTNRICADGTWEANLFNFYQRVLPRLQAALPKPFKLEGNIRQEETPAHVAVREALINLCIHADYSINASLVVRHELHRFVFSNPGTLLVSLDQYYTGGESVCRNKSLQKMFSMIGVAEKAGSGTDKIMKGWKDTNWRSPNIYEQQEPDKVVLVMPMESFLSEETKAKLTEKFGIVANSFDHHVLSILALACDEGTVTNTRLRYSLSLHKAEIANILKLMTQKGLLITEGHGRGMRYLLPEKRPDFLNVATSEANVATLEGSKVATSEAKVASSEAKVATSEGSKVATSEAKVATSEAKVATSIKKKMSREELQSLIMSVCNEWISLEDLSARIERDSKYLRNQIIPLMLASKKLQMLFPGTPNHPNQQYKVTD